MVIPSSHLAWCGRALARHAFKVARGQAPCGAIYMMRSQRRTHILAWCVLAPAMLALLFAAITSRLRAAAELSRQPRETVKERVP